MAFSFFSYGLKEKILSYLPKKVIFLDFDDTIAKPQRKPNGQYNSDINGFIPATHLHQDKFRSLVNESIKHRIPLYFITGRPDIPACRQLLFDFIKSVDGFHSGIGGFKLDSICFISKLSHEKEQQVWKPITTKHKVIQYIHKNHFAHLHPHAILFIDDMEEYLKPVKDFGYRTIKADPKSLSHFVEAERFMEPGFEMEGPGTKLHSGPVKLRSLRQ